MILSRLRYRLVTVPLQLQRFRDLPSATVTLRTLQSLQALHILSYKNLLMNCFKINLLFKHKIAIC
jgi:hypothetical protein